MSQGLAQGEWPLSLGHIRVDERKALIWMPGAREHYDANRVAHVPDSARQFKSRHPRHHVIDDRCIHRMRAKQLQSICAAAGGEYLIAACFQDGAADEQDVLGV